MECILWSYRNNYRREGERDYRKHLYVIKISVVTSGKAEVFGLFLESPWKILLLCQEGSDTLDMDQNMLYMVAIQPWICVLYKINVYLHVYML